MAINPETTIRKLISFPRDLVQEVNDYRFDERIAAESEALRRLVRIGLEVERERKRAAGRQDAA